MEFLMDFIWNNLGKVKTSDTRGVALVRDMAVLLDGRFGTLKGDDWGRGEGVLQARH